MLIRILILTIAIVLTNGFPAAPQENDIIALQDPEQQAVYPQSAQDITDINFQNCVGADKICVNRVHCPNGYVNNIENTFYSLPNERQECNYQNEICCSFIEDSQEITRSQIDFGVKTPPKEHQSASINLGTLVLGTKDIVRPPTTPGIDEANVQGSDSFLSAAHVQLGCAAALLCVEDKFCTLDGTISTEPVSLTQKQLLRRVPLSPCRNLENGIIGRCCRDPNYVDPWPTGNLPANYSGGFDELGFPTFLNTAKRSTTTEKPEPSLVPDNTIFSPNVLVPPKSATEDEGKSSQPTATCGIRNKSRQTEDSKTNFGEIPWQAMVLQSIERKILCSGVLVSTRHVLTTANCIHSFSPNDISVKLGEWKLGYELKHEEPLAYEILNVSSISIHPSYTKESRQHDLAILHLNSPTSFDVHINPLCLPKAEKQPQASDKCISSGWGKSILQANYAGAVMRVVDMDIVPTKYCTDQLIKADLNQDIANGVICTVTKKQINNVCEADIGAALACENQDGLYELSGIYSQDTGCAPSNTVAIFTPFDETWMMETMSSLEQLPFTDDYQKSTLSMDNQYLPPH